jgi:hypothetical protein
MLYMFQFSALCARTIIERAEAVERKELEVEREHRRQCANIGARSICYLLF